MLPLENPPENPCFGCGPQHARGLRLSFTHRVGIDGEPDEVRTEYVPKPDEIGWPGLFHTGLHFMTLFEAAYWAALTLTGRVHVATGPQVLDQKRLPRVGAPFRLRAWISGSHDGGPIVSAISESPEGKPFASLEVRFRTESRARVEKAGLKLPQYLLDELEP